MTNPSSNVSQVDITLASKVVKEVSTASVLVGDVYIRGIKIYASKTGKPKIYFPSHKQNGAWVETVVVPKELREDIEAQVLEAYKAKRARVEALEASASLKGDREKNRMLTASAKMTKEQK